MGYAALQSDGIVFGTRRRFAAGAGIAAFAMLHDIGASLQGAALAYPGYITAVPLHAEFEILVGIEALWVDAELHPHGWSPLLRPGPGRPSAGSGSIRTPRA